MEESKIESSNNKKEINSADPTSRILTKNNVMDFSIGLVSSLVINTIFFMLIFNILYLDSFFNDYGLFYYSVVQFMFYAIEFFILRRLKYDYIANGVLSVGIFLLFGALFVLWLFRDLSF